MFNTFDGPACVCKLSIPLKEIVTTACEGHDAAAWDGRTVSQNTNESIHHDYCLVGQKEAHQSSNCRKPATETSRILGPHPVTLRSKVILAWCRCQRVQLERKWLSPDISEVLKMQHYGQELKRIAAKDSDDVQSMGIHQAQLCHEENCRIKEGGCESMDHTGIMVPIEPVLRCKANREHGHGYIMPCGD
ncbi:hypothetical protein M405DRAFT_842802 [Rhizopogon salebrosus TDB-379]|nr:hypothetical protein M405DRAFT_842802 [Rhizopogon salebrosus TDB-379]